MALCDGPELEPARAALEHANCRWHLPGGAKVFVFPEQFAAVSAALARHTLRAHHVVVAEAFEPLVHEAVRRLPCRSSVVLREAEPLAFLSNEGDVVVVNRTFVHIAQAMHTSQSVIQSTTEAHHGGLNPRRPLVQ